MVAVVEVFETPGGVDGAGGMPLFLPFSSLAEVASEPEWLWRGFLAAGELTLLAGQAFVGKSTFVGGLLSAVEGGAAFLGLPTSAATALLVSEESNAILRERAGRFGLLSSGSSFGSRGTRVSSYPWPELIKRATEAALAADHELLVIDTFAGLAQLGPEEENDAGAIAEKMLPLQQAAAAGLAVLLLHHTTKGGGSIRGSSAFAGTADIAIRMARTRDLDKFVLHSQSRYESTPGRLTGTLVKAPAGWHYGASTQQSKKPPSTKTTGPSHDEQLLAVIRAAGDGGVTYDELARDHAISKSSAKRRLPNLYDDDKVGRTGSGRKGSPFRWLVPS